MNAQLLPKDALTLAANAGVTSSELDVVASQPQSVSCAAPSPLGTYDTYCEGLQADYFLLPKQKVAPSLTNLKPNVSTFVTSLNDTVSGSQHIRLCVLHLLLL